MVTKSELRGQHHDQGSHMAEAGMIRTLEELKQAHTAITQQYSALQGGVVDNYHVTKYPNII